VAVTGARRTSVHIRRMRQLIDTVWPAGSVPSISSSSNARTLFVENGCVHGRIIPVRLDESEGDDDGKVQRAPSADPSHDSRLIRSNEPG